MEYRIENALKSVFKIVHSDQNIAKYLYYPGTDGDFDPLSEDDLNISQRDSVIKKTGIIVELEDYSASNPDKRGRIGIFLQNSSPNDNPLTPERRIRIEIYMPLRNFEEFNYRIAYIVQRLDDLLLQEKVDGGFGRLIMVSSNTTGAIADGYVSYYHDYNIGSIKQQKR